MDAGTPRTVLHDRQQPLCLRLDTEARKRRRLLVGRPAVLLHNAVQTVKIGAIGKSTLAVIKAQKRTAAVRQDKISVCFPVLRAEIRQNAQGKKTLLALFYDLGGIHRNLQAVSHEDKVHRDRIGILRKFKSCPKTVG